MIRTIGGDLPAGAAGPVYTHEHLLIDSPLVAETMPHIHLPSVDEAAAEIRTCVAVGIRTMVDAMPAASGRDPERLSRISLVTGMRIVAATGLHTDRYYGALPWTRSETPDQLAARFVADIEHGIDIHDYMSETVERTDVKAGIVKAAALAEELADRDLRLFEAAVITAEATGVPVLTHTEGGLGGLNQLEALLDLGARPGRVAVSHTDKVQDLGYHLSMLETGAFLCYDQGIRDPDKTFHIIRAVADSGFADQLVLGTDGARRSLWRTLGGAPGLSALYTTALERLDHDLVERLFVANPARYLSLDST